MLNVTGEFNKATVYTNVVDKQTIGQIIELCNQKFAQGETIRIMPDCHMGAGCTIGTTMTLTDKVVPNLVGVDIGCVSHDTEYLTKDGWRRISEYNGEEILVFNKDTNSSYFEKPVAYIKEECSEFYHIKTKYGVDQKVSKDHKMLFVKGSHHRPANRGGMYDKLAEDVFNSHQKAKLGFRDKMIANIPNIIVPFDGVDMSDAEIRLKVMVCADGHLENDAGWCVCAFKKERKIKRAEKLLKDTNTPYECTVSNGITKFIFYTDLKNRKLVDCLKDVNLEQSKIVLDELRYWDCEKSTHIFWTKLKEDADFVQYLWSINNMRATISFDDRQDKECYRVIPSSNTLVGFAGTPKTPINIVVSEDGYKYCFTTSTGYWIMRHNDCICVTGNCGMLVAKLKKGSNFSLEHLDSFITRSIPSGHSIRAEIPTQAKGKHNLEKLRCANIVNIDRAEKSIGTLGGGNHFIEVSKDESTNDIYIIIHSGSRNLGKQVAEHYQKKAIAYHKGKQDREVKELIRECKEAGTAYKILHALQDRKFRKIPEHLAYLEGQDFEDYIHDMKIIQRYAEINREMMLVDILRAIECEVEEVFHTIHNYIDMRDKTNLILRKGAVSALNGEKLLIPINMRDGSLLCRGKSNPEWNNSAPHGAGRLMSRKQAKEQLSMEEFQEQMKGIHTTSVVESTLDEAPDAYKSMEDIVGNIGDTVDVIAVLKPVYNYKAH